MHLCFLAARPLQPAALKHAFFGTADPAFWHISCIPPTSSPNQPSEAGATCCGKSLAFTHNSFLLFSLPSRTRKQISPLILESPCSWYSQENPRICCLPGDQASLHPTAFLPPGWSPCLTFLPSCLSIIPWFGWLRCSCCNFSEWLRDWKGS